MGNPPPTSGLSSILLRLGLGSFKNLGPRISVESPCFSLGDIPEETPAAPSAQSPEEPAAGSPSAQEPTPGETPKPEEKEGSPDQVPGPAAEPPSPATQESDRTLAEESLCPAPEAAGVSPSPGSEETASSAEPGSSPYLTPDFGKEDPSLILGKVVRGCWLQVRL